MWIHEQSACSYLRELEHSMVIFDSVRSYYTIVRTIKGPSTFIGWS